MKSANKDFEMRRFIKGETSIMIATTVIEVGVNVPNASIMVIESAERFGLSQYINSEDESDAAMNNLIALVTGMKLTAEAKARYKP